MHNAPALDISGIEKRFGDQRALAGVGFQVPQSGIFGLLGPNGAGKTTLIRMLNGITAPDAGSISFFGEPLTRNHLPVIGYLPEERGLYKSMRVGEQAMYFAQLRGLDKKSARERLRHWFDRLEVDGWWNKEVSEVSKGMAQKIQFVVTVLHRPKLLIFDEPFSGFDPINAQIIQKEILRLRDDGATVIFSTHRMESVEELCDHIALVHQSKKILDGNLTQIKRDHLSNSFKVGIECTDPQKTFQELKQVFSIRPTSFKSVYHGVQFSVQLSEQDVPNQVLSKLSGYGMVYHFVAEVPSANDLFVQAISQNNKNGEGL